MRGRNRALAALAPLVGVIAACGGTTHNATQQEPVARTHAYKQGYRMGYNAVITGEAAECGPRSARLRKAGRLKSKADVRRFVAGCDVGAHDAGLTE
jgi:hypothetical protein